RDLVDEFRVMIDPVVVGGGKRLFRDDGVRRPLRLVDSQVTTTGVIVATYASARGEPASPGRSSTSVPGGGP
ncbi:MAG TPA: dihydrofolate reductase family protein, partial [Actinomycetota bacterium]|nr:dihydrofolate reductase family protein [Actinomycetota bacterium]